MGKKFSFSSNSRSKMSLSLSGSSSKPPSLICISDAHQLYQIFPSAPSDEIIIRVFIQTDAAINPINSGGILLDGKVRTVVMNTSIVTTSVSNTGIGLAVPVDWFKPDVEDMLLMDHILRRAKGTNVESDN